MQVRLIGTRQIYGSISIFKFDHIKSNSFIFELTFVLVPNVVLKMYLSKITKDIYIFSLHV